MAKKKFKADKAHKWIMDNWNKMSRETLRTAFTRWGILAGYKRLDGDDMIWLQESVGK